MSALLLLLLLLLRWLLLPLRCRYKDCWPLYSS